MDLNLPDQPAFDTVTLSVALGVPYARIIAAIQYGRLKARRVGKRWVIDRADAVAFAGANRRPAMDR